MRKSIIVVPFLAISFLTNCNKASKYDVMFENSKRMIAECVNPDDYLSKSKDDILSEVEEKTFTDVLDRENKTYYFKNFDYETVASVWPCAYHLTRTLKIAVAAYKRSDKDIMEIAHKLSSFWLCKDFYNDQNWYYSIIGVPSDLGDTAFFIYDLLSAKEKEKLLDIVRYGAFDYGPQPGDQYYDNHPTKQTGCNLYDVALITLKAAILARDENELASVNQYLLPGITENEKEGFQDDGSFFQHGKVLQSGCYGRQGLIRLIKIMKTYDGAGIEGIPDENKRIIMNFVVNGLKYLTHKGAFNYASMGRTYSRPTSLDIHGGTTDAGDLSFLRFLKDDKNLPYRDEFLQFLDDLENDRPTFNGIHCNARSSLITTMVDNIYISFRGTNEQLCNSENNNGENILGHNLSYGCNTCVMETGQEYFEASPVWDYSYLPGTTAIEESDEVLKGYERLEYKRELQGFFKIANPSPNENEIISMQQTKYKVHDGDDRKNDKEVSFTVTCFATNKGMAILGAGLSHSSGKPIHTTIEQCVMVPGITHELANDSHLLRNGNVYYRSLDDQNIIIEENTINGNWIRNNTAYNRPATSDVLKAYIPITKGTYAYSIQTPSTKDMQFVVANNTENVQAVVVPNENKIIAAFYNDGSFIYNGNTYEGSKGDIKTFNLSTNR